MANTESLDLHILERFVNDSKLKEFKNKFELYKEAINYLSLENAHLEPDELKYYQSLKIEIEDFFYENGLQKTIDKIKNQEFKIFEDKILNKIAIFEEKTEVELLQKMQDFLINIVKKTDKKVEPSYGSVRTIVDGFKIQISYKIIEF